MVARLQAEARKAGKTPLEYVCGRYGDGETQKAIAESLSGTSSTLRSWVKAQPGGPEAWAAARQDGGEAVVDHMEEIAQELVDTDASKERVLATRELLKVKELQARSRNPAVYGNQPQVAVQLNVGQLMLDAFQRTRVLPVAHVTPQLSAGEPDVELVPTEA
jgi:hypothetical protein